MRWVAGLVWMLLGSGVAHAEKCPNMLIVLDRSFSMSEAGKWAAANQAIASFTRARQSLMRFGLHVFPAKGEGCGGGDALVDADFYTAPAIEAALAAFSPGGSTPTSQAIAEAGTTPALKDETRRRFVILVTDGDATCPSEDDVPASHALAVQEVAKLLQRGIKTFVIVFGTAATPARLDELAQAGGTARTGAQCEDPRGPGKIPCKYYDAVDQASLEQAFDAIAAVASGELQGRTCDDSCYGPGGCPEGSRCTMDLRTYGTTTLNTGRCEPDPCAGKACGSNQFCREGTCRDACLQSCPASQICVDGACATDPCIADPASCECPTPCPRFLVCLDGTCQDDPCRYVSCPASAPFCNLGSCYAGPPPPAGPLAPKSPAARDDEVSDDSGVGCTCASAGPGLLLPAVLLPLGLRLLRSAGGGSRKRDRTERRSRAALR